ncbi:hypothetical protein Taro_043195, partial [Colocasia esculenta]|nr:hypothetical protein [Colocasia esculenta]
NRDAVRRRDKDASATPAATRTRQPGADRFLHRLGVGDIDVGVPPEHYTGKSLEDAIASVPAGVDSFDWQMMCEKWNTSDEQRLVQDRESNLVEIFKIGRCKELPDGTDQWVDDESRSRYERMIQLSTPSLDSESESTPISTEEAFGSVMEKDRSGRVRYRGSRETLRTWYGTREGSSSSTYQ